MNNKTQLQYWTVLGPADPSGVTSEDGYMRGGVTLKYNYTVTNSGVSSVGQQELFKIFNQCLDQHIASMTIYKDCISPYNTPPDEREYKVTAKIHSDWVEVKASKVDLRTSEGR